MTVSSGLRLYSYWRSSSSYRVRIGLALKGLAYEYVPVDISPAGGAQHAAGFEAVSPLRQVPVLEWAEGHRLVRLTQSVAILEYLEEQWPGSPLLPRSALLRARVREAIEVVNAGIQPLQNSGTLARLRAVGGEPLASAWARGCIEAGLNALERLAASCAESLAASSPFFAGGSPSLAECFIVPQLYNARRFGVALEPYPILRRIERSALSLPAVDAAAPERQPDAPQREDGAAPARKGAHDGTR